MTDLVERLRRMDWCGVEVCIEAADEIESLRTKLAEVEKERDELKSDYYACRRERDELFKPTDTAWITYLEGKECAEWEMGGKLAATEALLATYREALELLWGTMPLEQRSEWDSKAGIFFDGLLTNPTPTAALNAAIADELDRWREELSLQGLIVLEARIKELRG